jgi:hypothetical protein
MLLNIPAIEASFDLRLIFVGGAIFAGEKGKEYIEFLQEVMFDSDPDKIQSGKAMLEAAEAGRGNFAQPPRKGDDQ